MEITLGQQYNVLLLFLTFSVLVANPKNYSTRWPIPLARGLLNRKKKKKRLAVHVGEGG